MSKGLDVAIAKGRSSLKTNRKVKIRFCGRRKFGNERDHNEFFIYYLVLYWLLTKVSWEMRSGEQDKRTNPVS